MKNDSDIILFAQQFIGNYLQEKALDKINAFEWGRTEKDWDRKLYRLKLYSGAKSFNLLFSREELTDDFETKKWEEKFIKKIDQFLIKIPH